MDRSTRTLTLRLMRHWEQVLPGRVYTVQYEELVSNPNEVVSRLLEHCGLEWEDQVLHFYKSRRVVHTFSARQVRSPRA